MIVEALLSTVRKNLVTINDEARLTEAAALLGGGVANLLVVCDNAGVAAGVISKTDIVSRIGQCQGRACMARVRSVMTQEVICCHPEDMTSDVWTVMKENSLRHMPVLDRAHRPVGVLKASDALGVLLDEVEHEEALLRDYVMGLGYR